MKKIRLNNTGHYALIDNQDYDWIMSFGRWYENDRGYAVKRVKVDGKNKTIRMHKLINNTPDGLVTDHINGNKLDNRRKNLRAVSIQINAWNTKLVNRHKKYDLPAGVSYDKSRDKFYGTQVIRRRFSTLEEAVAFVKKSHKEVEYGRH